MTFTRHLRPAEEDCLNKCVEKYLLLSTGVGTTFTEVLAAP